jgi:hypothetical protein
LTVGAVPGKPRVGEGSFQAAWRTAVIQGGAGRVGAPAWGDAAALAGDDPYPRPARAAGGVSPVTDQHPRAETAAAPYPPPAYSRPSPASPATSPSPRRHCVAPATPSSPTSNTKSRPWSTSTNTNHYIRNPLVWLKRGRQSAKCASKQTAVPSHAKSCQPSTLSTTAISPSSRKFARMGQLGSPENRGVGSSILPLTTNPDFGP